MLNLSSSLYFLILVSSFMSHIKSLIAGNPSNENTWASKVKRCCPQNPSQA